ncbi:MAG: type II toxin-antitoxin system VapC family toxin [Spartobacteria bacterium]
MRLLLDTHALIWFCEGHSKLGKKARAALEDNSNECFVSQATPWEMAIKLSLGRLELRMGLAEFFPGCFMQTASFFWNPRCPITPNWLTYPSATGIRLTDCS